MYGMVGSCTHLAMVNSSWTKSHIEVLWRIPERITRVYPPCDTSGLQVITFRQLESYDFCLFSGYISVFADILGLLQAFPLERSSDPPKIISVAQFRPEKVRDPVFDL